ncbi:site-specific integrase [Lentzea tibetensis]|uniref:Site-specific integrase n=1 Tax=Lentzea tibetensis TaxID=2591470 RepID=A0A563EVL9_9PSEU|nr:site-specific integrase [Lentzea tibetensis]TWP51531.1 site-specific integrase [Lentzea tibetensis]
MGRKSNGESSIYEGSDGYWHGRVTVGTKDDGSPDRRHVQALTRPEVAKKVAKLEQERDAGKVRKTGKAWTVEKWLNHWLENIVAPPAITENAFSAYEVAARVHLIPGIGKHRIDKLEPEHLEKFYRKMIREGAKSSRAHQVHRTIRAALNIAVRRKHITENPALLAHAPKIEDFEVEPYTVDEVKKLLEAAQARRNSARWAIALALGLRQGEALGLRWADVNLDVGTLNVRRSRLRPRWKHGCADSCGRKLGGHCPQRVPLRKETAGTKSRAGTRGIGLPDELVTLLEQHRATQGRERQRAAQLWTESGYVFTTPTGGPLNPRTDYTEWKRLLKAAGVPDGRLHDARHTAATVLLLLGVAERTVMGIMGWSNTAMAAKYQHITAAIRRDVAQRVGGLLWRPAEAADESGDEDGTAAVPVPA